MNLQELTPAGYNPRVKLKPGDPEWEALNESIQEFGYILPIIWNEDTGNIVGGNQRRNILQRVNRYVEDYGKLALSKAVMDKVKGLA